MPLLLFTSRAGPRRRAGPERVPRRALRRPRRPPLARAQLPRGDDGLRPRRDQRRGGDVRQAGHRVLTMTVAGRRAGQHPEPVVGTPRDRAAVAQRLRADDRPRRRRRRVAVRPPPRGAQHRHPRGRQRDRRVGRHRRRDRRPHLPRRHRLGALRGRLVAGVRRSGRAASASPAGCSPASSSARGPATGGASRSAPASTPSRRRLPLAQAIGRWGNYFNQELYGRPTTLPWALEIDAQHLPSNGQYAVGHDVPPDVPLRVAVEPAAVRRCCCGSTASSSWPTGSCWRSTSSATASGGSGSRACASTRPTTCSGCAGTSGWRSC